MFADMGAIDRGADEYASWNELARMQRSGRWEIQLHAGRGHHNIPSAPGTTGPFYANRDVRADESLEDWRERVTADLDWGERQLRRHVPGYRPLGFAPPYGAYGQLADERPGDPARALRASCAAATASCSSRRTRARRARATRWSRASSSPAR